MVMQTVKLFSHLVISSVLMIAVFAQGFSLSQAQESSESASQSPTPTLTPTPTPTIPPETEPTFPSCSELISQPGDHASWRDGWHQIVGGSLVYGSDDVYALEDGNYVQCYCPNEGSEGIQTNWWRTLSEVQGWLVENGLQWNLGDHRYLAQNSSFSCRTPTPTPSAIPGPTPSPSPTPTPQPSTSSGVGGTTTPTTTSESSNEVAGAFELAFTGSPSSGDVRMLGGLLLSLGSLVISRLYWRL